MSWHFGSSLLVLANGQRRAGVRMCGLTVRPLESRGPIPSLVGCDLELEPCVFLAALKTFCRRCKASVNFLGRPLSPFAMPRG